LDGLFVLHRLGLSLFSLALSELFELFTVDLSLLQALEFWVELSDLFDEFTDEQLLGQ